MKSQNDRGAFTARVLLSLVNDLATAKEHLRAIEVQIATLAKEHGVKMPSP
jgi:hypothetical protein